MESLSGITLLLRPWAPCSAGRVTLSPHLRCVLYHVPALLLPPHPCLSQSYDTQAK